MPGERAAPPAGAIVALSQGCAKGKDAVEVSEGKTGDILRRGDGAMVGVVEKKSEPAAQSAGAADAFHQRGFVPFVDEDDVGFGDQLFMGEIVVVDDRPQFGEI